MQCSLHMSIESPILRDVIEHEFKHRYFHNTSTGVTTWIRPEEEQPVILKIRFKGKSHDVKIACANQCTLDGLRRRVEVLTKIPCEEQKLIFKGQTFTQVGDKRSLNSLGLKNGSRIMVMSSSSKNLRRQILKQEDLRLHLVFAASSESTSVTKRVTTESTSMSSLSKEDPTTMTYYCSSVGFMKPDDVFTSVMKSVRSI